MNYGQHNHRLQGIEEDECGIACPGREAHTVHYPCGRKCEYGHKRCKQIVLCNLAVGLLQHEQGVGRKIHQQAHKGEFGKQGRFRREFPHPQAENRFRIGNDNDSLVLVTSSDHPFANKDIVTLDELKKEKLIIRLPGSGTRTLFEASLQSANRSIEEFNIIVEVDNVATIKELVQHNLGVSILARSACLEEAKDKRLRVIPVQELSMNREINIVCNKDFEHKEILDLIKSIYKTTIKEYQSDL